MPRKPIDYSKALIYSIVCKTDPTLLYIGSTTNFRIRKNDHKCRSLKTDNNPKNNIKIYKLIRANGGWDAFEMSPIKEFPCENSIQLKIEEERIRKEMNANLNGCRAITTIEERKQDQIKTSKAYREDNKDEVRVKKRIYREDNKDKIKEKKKTEYKKNKEKVISRSNEYYLANKERILAKRKENYKKKYL
jgi:hypothetical protein